MILAWSQILQRRGPFSLFVSSKHFHHLVLPPRQRTIVQSLGRCFVSETLYFRLIQVAQIVRLLLLLGFLFRDCLLVES